MTPSKVRANGVDFTCLEIGQGPLVLCLHGFPDTAWSFAPLLKRLADAGYRGGVIHARLSAQRTSAERRLPRHYAWARRAGID